MCSQLLSCIVLELLSFSHSPANVTLENLFFYLKSSKLSYHCLLQTASSKEFDHGNFISNHHLLALDQNYFVLCSMLEWIFSFLKILFLCMKILNSMFKNCYFVQPLLCFQGIQILCLMQTFEHFDLVQNMKDFTLRIFFLDKWKFHFNQDHDYI